MPRRRMRGIWGLLTVAGLTTSMAVVGTTYGELSDFRVDGPQHVGAGEWTPDPPAACGDLSQYGTPPHRFDAVAWGTPGDDVIHGGNRPQIIMGLGGDDVIYGGNSGDCLVGGDGDDRLIGGNAKDILLGGAGNDYLSGDNGKDSLDGEEDLDECEGGNGNDTIVNCELAPGTLASRVAPEGTSPKAESNSAVGASSDQAAHPNTGQRGTATPLASPKIEPKTEPKTEPTPMPAPAPEPAPAEVSAPAADG